MIKTTTGKRGVAFCLLLCISFLLLATGCGSTQEQADAMQKRFDDYCNTWFMEEMTSDSLTLHFALAEPEAYGIEGIEPTLGDISGADYNADMQELRNMEQALKTFDLEKLTEEQQLTYALLQDTIQLQLGMTEEMYYYDQILTASSGVPINFPTTMAEYTFRTKEDVETYLQLLQQTPEYFDSAIAYTQKQRELGVFMLTETLEEAIALCDTMVQGGEEHYLATTFAERLQQVPSLTEGEKQAYLAENQALLENAVFPAYQTLKTALEEWRGKGESSGGLAHLPQGKAYYQLLVQDKTGSDRSIEELLELLQEQMMQNLMTIYQLVQSHPELEEQLAQHYAVLDNPQRLMEQFLEYSQQDFPAIGDFQYSVKQLPASLGSTFNASAFYTIPQLDALSENAITINQAHTTGDATDVLTLAHEGIPGHLYQNTYFLQNNPSPVRYLLNKGGYLGYTEGWAEYVSYRYALSALGKSPELQRLVQAYQQFDRQLTCILDIEIHYNGWTLPQVEQYFADLGLNESIAPTIYQAILESPAAYLSYGIGELEMSLLRQEAEQTLGDQFDAKKFHTFLLEMGPAPFAMIGEKMQQWMAQQ